MRCRSIVLVAMLCAATARPRLFAARALVPRVLCAVRGGAAGTRALLCPATIARACDSGIFTVTQMEYMRASRESCDARDVSWHRSVTRLVGAQGNEPDRVRNNAIMHALEDAEYAVAMPPNATARTGRGRGRRRG